MPLAEIPRQASERYAASMRITGPGVVAACLATAVAIYLFQFARENFFRAEPPPPPDSPIGTFEFTIVGEWMHEGPAKQGTRGTQDADWSITLVVRPDGTFQYAWESLRQTPSPSGLLGGTWHDANQGVGPSSRHWHLRIPGRPEPSRVLSLSGGPVLDEFSWYSDSGWLMSAIEPETGELTSAMWLHRKGPRR